MRILVILLAVLAMELGLAQKSSPPPPPHRPSPPKGRGTIGPIEQPTGKSPCCFPNQWSGKREEHTVYRDQTGYSSEEYTITAFEFDFPADLFRKNIVAYDKNHEVVKNITQYGDVNKRRLDVLLGDEGGCIWQDMPKTYLGQCITKKASFKGSDTIGNGDSAVNVDKYLASFKSGNTHIYMKIGVTSESCVPVFSYISGKIGSGAEIAINSKFYNNKVVIDPSVLDKPTQCDEAAKVETNDQVKGKMFLFDLFFAAKYPQKCCFPKTWEGKMSTKGSVNDNRGTYNMQALMPQVAVDYNKLKVAATMYISKNGVSYKNVTIVEDLRFGMLYIKDVDSQECKKYNVPTAEKMTWECVPANARYDGNPVVGINDQGLDTSLWNIKTENPEDDFNWDITLNVAQMNGVCFPVSELGFGKSTNSRMMLSNRFYDLWKGVKDDNIFRPPDGCNGLSGESWENIPQPLYIPVKGFVRGL